MSEWRVDHLTGRSALIAPERAQRPLLVEPVASSSNDPFLEGHESETPGELFAIRDAGTDPDSPGWQVRVVPNRFPAVRIDPSLVTGTQESADGRSAVGVHEVIVECPHFETNLGRLPADAVVDVLHAWRERLRVHSRDPRLEHAVVFKNQGRAAGATMAHSHSQLIATPFVLPGIARNLERASTFEDILRHEEEHESRIVESTEQALVWCPRVSRFSYETRILARDGGGRFEAAGDEQLQALGIALKQTLRRLEIALNDPPLNLILHTVPFSQAQFAGDCWWIEIIPRLSGVGGFELGSGCFITTTFPEEAARILRTIPERAL